MMRHSLIGSVLVHPVFCHVLWALAVLWIVASPQPARGQTITEIIHAGLLSPRGIAVDGIGNVYVTGANTNNAFKIAPDGTITEIIDASGDGAGNELDGPILVALDGSGNVFITGCYSDNAFKITP